MTPRSTTSCGSSRDRSSPRNTIAPLFHCTRRETFLSVVDFPAPFAPTSVTISPSSMVMSIPHSTCRSPYANSSFSMESSAVILPSEVGLDDLRVLDDLLRRPLGQLLAGVEHDDAVGQPHDRFH